MSAKEKNKTNNDRIPVYHGSFDASLLRRTGFNFEDVPVYVSRDIAAAQDAIGPHRIGIEYAKDPGIVVSLIPRDEFNTLMLPFERPYNGFFPYKIVSTEILLRTPAQLILFNSNMIRY